jgi:hypothetical protein
VIHLGLDITGWGPHWLESGNRKAEKKKWLNSMVYGGLWWFMVVYGGLWWFMVDRTN